MGKMSKFSERKNHSDNDVNTDLVRVALAYALSRNEMKFIQSLIQTGCRTRFYLDLVKVFARLLNIMKINHKYVLNLYVNYGIEY